MFQLYYNISVIVFFGTDHGQNIKSNIKSTRRYREPLLEAMAKVETLQMSINVFFLEKIEKNVNLVNI